MTLPRFWVCMLFGTGLLVACATNNASLPSSTAPLQAWHVTLRLSGGFAGLNRVLEIADNGDLTATDARRGTKIATMVPANELMRLSGLVGKPASAEAARETNCRDCFLYQVEIQRNGRTLTWRLNDMNLAGSEVEDLVKALASLLDRALAGQLSPK